jgi:hypothetical protein
LSQLANLKNYVKQNIQLLYNKLNYFV